MMTRITTRWISLGAVALAVIACGKRDADLPPDNQERDAELRLFQEGIQKVQDRYVDADRVQLEMILSNSIKGMVSSVDPFATILFTGESDEPFVPRDVPLVELNDLDHLSIASLKIHGFYPLMKKQLRNLESRARSQQAAGVLIDARGAGGMDYSAAVDMAAWLLPRGTMVGSVVEKQGSETRDLTTRRPPLWTDNPVVVLIDRETSGPSEWLAGALQFHKRAQLVGESTRGIGIIQTPVTISDHWTVMLTTGRVLYPDQRDQTGLPLTPDVAAEPPPGNKENVDWLFQRGLDVLRDVLTGESAAGFKREEFGSPTPEAAPSL
jgi:C-terminal processing protease CtpA/Prc